MPDVSQRVHWNSDWARKIGNPMAYDYSVLRDSWLHHYLTDWVGDDGWVFRQYDEVRKFNYMGDVQFLNGEVVGKRQEDGRCFVDLMVQDDQPARHGDHRLRGHRAAAEPRVRPGAAARAAGRRSR